MKVYSKINGHLHAWDVETECPQVAISEVKNHMMIDKGDTTLCFMAAIEGGKQKAPQQTVSMRY